MVGCVVTLQEVALSGTAKKQLAELMLWPITHQVGNTSGAVVRDTATTGPLPSWPTLMFIRPTPALDRDRWLVTFYLLYKDGGAGRARTNQQKNVHYDS